MIGALLSRQPGSNRKSKAYLIATLTPSIERFFRTNDLSAINRFARMFWSRVDSSGGIKACWPYVKPRKPSDDATYRVVGMATIRERWTEKAHRIAFVCANGWISFGKHKETILVRHSCDYPPCCNPMHLLGGSYTDNVRDCMERGRKPPPPSWIGEAHPRAKLTDSDVRAIRALLAQGDTMAAAARKYGVGKATIAHLRDGHTWSHVR